MGDKDINYDLKRESETTKLVFLLLHNILPQTWEPKTISIYCLIALLWPRAQEDSVADKTQAGPPVLPGLDWGCKVHCLGGSHMQTSSWGGSLSSPSDGLSTALLQCTQDMAAGFPGSERFKRIQQEPLCLLGPSFRSHTLTFKSVLLVTQVNPTQYRRGLHQGMSNMGQGSLGAVLDANCHKRQKIPREDREGANNSIPLAANDKKLLGDFLWDIVF